MRLSKNFIPTLIALFDIFQINLATIITTNYIAWNIPLATLNALLALQTTFVNAYAISKVKQSRTPANTLVTKNARIAYESGIRQFVKEWLKENGAVTEEQKREMGIHIDDLTKTKINPPTFSPIVSIKEITPGTVKVFAIIPQGEALSSFKTFPDGIRLIEIRAKIGSPAPANSEEFNIRGNSTKVKLELPFDPVQDRGKVIYITVCYVSPDGRRGPFSPTITAYIP